MSSSNITLSSEKSIQAADHPYLTRQSFVDSHIKNLINDLEKMQSELSPAISFLNYRVLTEVISFYQKFYQIDFRNFYTTIISQQKTTAQALLFFASELYSTGQHGAAIIAIKRAIQLEPSSPYPMLLHADLLRQNGAIEEARSVALEGARRWPDMQDFNAILDLCAIDEALPVTDEHYHLLHKAHRLLAPRRYLEIGVAIGKSLALAAKETKTIGVDPMTASMEQLFFHSPEAAPELFKVTSNDFFQQGGMEHSWNNAPLDMAFIDGLHLFEQALMDFIHLEQRSAPDSIIFIHDCLPVSIIGAERERSTMVWTGDVWKVILCLKTVRPDLEIVTFPVRPSGLAMVRKLDRSSKLLATQFDALVAHFMDATLPESMSERFRLLNVTEIPYETALESIWQQQGSWQERPTEP